MFEALNQARAVSAAAYGSAGEHQVTARLFSAMITFCFHHLFDFSGSQSIALHIL